MKYLKFIGILTTLYFIGNMINPSEADVAMGLIWIILLVSFVAMVFGTISWYGKIYRNSLKKLEGKI